MVIVDDVFDVGNMPFERSPEAAVSREVAAASHRVAAVSRRAAGGALVAISLA